MVSRLEEFDKSGSISILFIVTNLQSLSLSLSFIPNLDV